MAEQPQAVGVDGCRAGWLAVTFDGEACAVSVVSSARSLVEQVPEATIFIDMPIGLPHVDQPVRRCEPEARKLLGPRRSSVFNVPCREALDAPTYADGSARNAAITGRKLSRQSWAIVPKIRELDELLLARPALRASLREAHPEVCFAQASGAPMRHHKATERGFQERRAVLEERLPCARALLASAPWTALAGVQRDDVVDAMMLAWCAHRPDQWRTVPEIPDEDARGLTMEMVYRIGCE